MGVVARFVTLLDNWSEGRKPSCADSQHLIGAWAAKGLIQYFAFEYVVQLTWKNGGQGAYNYLTNYISDLGATVCDPYNGRWLCSQGFAAMDLSFIYLGIGVVVAGMLITSAVLRVAAHPGDLMTLRRQREDAPLDPGGPWRQLARHFAGVHSGHKLTHWDCLALLERCALVVTGAGLVAIGVFPENYNQFMHEAGLAILVVGSFLALLSLGVLWLPRTNWALLLLGLALVSLAAAIIMTWFGGFGLPGLFERAVVYAFIAGMLTMGLMVSHGAHKARRRKFAPRTTQTLAVRLTKRQSSRPAAGAPETPETPETPEGTPQFLAIRPMR